MLHQKNKPVAKLTAISLGWTMGFLEGEGSIGYQRRISKYKNNVRVSACQKSPECLYRLQALFGGVIYFRRRNPIWTWNLNGQPAIKLAETWYHFGSEKRRERIEEILGYVPRFGSIKSRKREARKG